jgi:carbon-monoxide dehydrogenase large subunit
MSENSEGATWFGRSVPRKEDPALLTGRGRFTDDLQPEGILHACVLRSSHAHARIRGVDTRNARALAGVHAVYTFADLPEVLRQKNLPLMSANPLIRQPLSQPVMAKDEVRYVGESIAVVVAESRRVAEDAAALIAVDYEPLPAVNDAREALRPGADTVHAGAPSNLVADVPFKVGDVDAAFAAARKVVRGSFTIHRGGAFSLETRGCIAVPNVELGTHTVYCTTQSPHRIKRILMDMLEFADHEIRVI